MLHKKEYTMSMKEIRFHGRGGQGAVMAAKMVASAAAEEGMCVASFPMYGFERRGMPVIAFTRLDDKPIQEKIQIYTPDCLMVIDPTLLGIKTLFDGLKPGGVLILNSAKPFDKRPSPNLAKVGVINATHVALCEIGRDIPNTCLIGALAATTGWLSLEAVIKGLGDYLDGEMLEMNIRNATRGFKEVEVQTWDS
jgi:2-oxoacid:acceptor oxidoreductase gamma subunit (pyruvate/2-ketoisovalerate family)